MALKLFVDNDVVLKLAQYGLLHRLLELFSAPTGTTEIFVLDSARYKLLPKRSPLELCKTESAAAQITAFLESATKLTPEAINLELIEVLNAAPGIDPGEALLFAGAANSKEGRVLTGDKRALLGLAEQDLEQISPLLSNKVITLEALIQGFVQLDHHATQHCIRTNPRVDKALTNVFGVSLAAAEESIHAGLASYVGHVRKALGPILSDGPPFD